MVERYMEHTANSTIALRIERLERIHGVRAVLCLDETIGGIIFKAPETLADIEARRHAIPLLELAGRLRLLRKLLPEDDGPTVLTVRSRKAEYVLCADDAQPITVAIVQDLQPGAEADAVSSLAVRQLRIWEGANVGAEGVDWLFGAADE